MSWNKKLHQLESLIDAKVSENTKNYNVLEQMPGLVKLCTGVQLSKLMEYASMVPELTEVPDNRKLTFASDYDLIVWNMVNILTAHGVQYFKDNHVTIEDTKPIRSESRDRSQYSRYSKSSITSPTE